MPSICAHSVVGSTSPRGRHMAATSLSTIPHSIDHLLLLIPPPCHQLMTTLANPRSTVGPPVPRGVPADALEDGAVPLNPQDDPRNPFRLLEAAEANRTHPPRGHPPRGHARQQQEDSSLRRHAAALAGTPQLIQQNLQAATPTTISTGPVTTGRPRSPTPPRRPQRERGNKRRRFLQRRGDAQPVRHADHDERITETQQGVRNWHRNNGAAGTFNAYSPKKLEWDDFCITVYGIPKCAAYGVDSVAALPPHEHAALFTVTPNKAYAFVFYHAHRSKVNGGKASKRARQRKGAGEEREEFDIVEYNSVFATYGGTSEDPPDPPTCCGFSQVNIYRCTVRDVWSEQKALNINSYSWTDDINTEALQTLMRKVKKRTPLVKRRNAEEKVDHQMAPFYYVKYLGAIEQAFFRKGVVPNRSTVFASLRNRLTLLFSLAGILRGESLEQADLSDLLDFFWTGTQDPHPMHIVIMQICQGKTNDDKKLWGRAMRHREVHMCAIGSLAMYLWYRMDVAGEWSESRPDFTDNKAWFFIKLLTSSRIGCDKEIPLDLKNYGNSLASILDALGVAAHHRNHFGRKVGPLLAEMAECDPRFTQQLGLWAQNQQEEAYSAHLPLPAMRAVAGHRKEMGSAFVARQTKPTTATEDRLRCLVFPWLDEERGRLEAFSTDSDNSGKHTANHFLGFLDNMRTVLLQDVAVMMNEDGCLPHSIFREAVFQSDDFGFYREEMKAHLVGSVDPCIHTIDSALPGLNARFDSLQAQQHETLSTVKTLLQEVADQPRRLLETVAAGARQAGATFADVLSPSPTEDGTPVQVIMPPGTAAELCLDGPQLASYHDSVKDLWDEWHGTGNYTDIPCPGGFEQLERTVGSQWRRSYNTAANIRFSKLQRIVKAVKQRVARDDPHNLATVIAEYDVLWADANANPSNMVKDLQECGDISRKARKKKSAVPSPTSTATTTYI